MTWRAIERQEDANALMKLFGGFHDGCVREAHLWTDHWVSEELAMSCPGDLDNRLRLLVQRQVKNPSAIELLFEQVMRFNLVPAPPNYDSIIFDATLLVRENAVYWSPDDEWSPDSPDRDESTWVAAKQLRWREVGWLGEELRYGPVDDPA